MPETARICRILARNPDAALEAIALPDGTVMTGEEQGELFAYKEPGSLRRARQADWRMAAKIVMPEKVKWAINTFKPYKEQGELFAYKEPGSLRRARQADWRMAAKIVMPEKVKWAINTFKPYKSAGPDGVFPALLQEGLEQIVGPLTRTLRAFIAMSYTPSAWKLVRVVFIPKAGRTSYTKAKDFRPISLTLFLLKTLEKLVDAYLRETTLWSHPLHKNQHAYRSGYSTETALHQTVAFIEEQLERKGYAVGAFLDIEGAFNNTPHEVVCEEAARRGVPIKLVEWIRGMLGRRVMTSLGTAKVCGWVGRGCPQGGVLSPLLWCLVADGLLRALDDRGFTAQGYTDTWQYLCEARS
nr:PREDICTED: RNA-directed DNA polymerase from mobile element jockey-like [Linepithema humile]